MDESYVVEEYPHSCGVQSRSMVEYLTSLEDALLFTVYFYLSILRF
jgi:hypothetical protein